MMHASVFVINMHTKLEPIPKIRFGPKKSLMGHMTLTTHIRGYFVIP